MRPSCFGYAVFVSPEFVRPSAQASAEEAAARAGMNESGSVSPYFPEVDAFSGLSALGADSVGLVSARSAGYDHL